MSFILTNRAENESKKTRIEPQLVLEIEGVSTLFGAVRILRLIRIGDEGLLIGNDWRIGGLTEVSDQADYLSLDGTGTRIDQQIQPDKGSVSSVSSIQVAIIDKKFLASKLISPGVLTEEILGSKATLWFGFKNTAFKQDYIPIFAGVIDECESGAGMVKINIAHPEQKKRIDLFSPVDVLIDGSIDATQTTIPLEDASQVYIPHAGPDGSFDDAIRFYIKVEDEIIRYTGVSGNNLTGCTRAELGSLNVAHAPDPDPVPATTLVRIEDAPIYIALKLMLSGKNGFFKEDLAIARYLHPTPSSYLANSIFFEGVDLTRDYGIVPGDFITITGATNGANNCAAKIILSIDTNDAGAFAVIDDVTFVEESGSAAVMSVRSQYDTLGYGCDMSGDQVDVTEHLYWHNAYMGNYTFRFVIEEKIEGKEFLDKEIYLPVGGYSIPRQGRCSMGYHIGPVIRGPLKVLSRSNIKDPDKIRLKRTTNRNFYNSIVTKFDKLVGSDKYVSGVVDFSVESFNQIRIGAKTLNIVSKGLRRSLDGIGIASRVAARYLGRYKKAAETLTNVMVLFRDGVTLEPGDNVVVDFDGLQITNTDDGTRVKPAKTFTITNRSLDLKTGEVKLELTDANFDGGERYGVVSPSSLVVGGTVSAIQIEDSFGAIYPGDEGKKWDEYAGQKIIVHDETWATEHEVILLGVNPANRYQLLLDPSTPLPSPPLAGWIVDIANYPDNTGTNDQAVYKAAHVFLGKSVSIVAGLSDTEFTINIGDAPYFQIGGVVRVHDKAYSNDSGEVLVQSVVGTTVTTATSMGFTPSVDDEADSLPMPDGAETYRLI